jgi:general secretion pathway protein I
VKRQRGFSLLEVILAFSLLAVALGILLAILSGGLAQVKNSGDASVATLHAQSLLAELGALDPITPGSRGGELDDGRYRWEMRIDEVEDPAPVALAGIGVDAIDSVGLQLASAPVLYRVQVDVAWGEDDYARSLRFVTLRARVPEPPVAVLP